MSRETTRYAPPRRRLRSRVERYAEAAAQIDLAVRNVRVLARGTIRAVRLDENVPPEVADAVRDLGAAVRAAGGGRAPRAVDRVREHALSAAATATRVLEETGNLSVSVIVGQVRSTATDLLAGTGMSADEAADEVRRAVAEAVEAPIAAGVAGRSGLADRTPERRPPADRGALERAPAPRARPPRTRCSIRSPVCAPPSRIASRNAARTARRSPSSSSVDSSSRAAAG